MLDEQFKLLEHFERRIQQLIAYCDTLRVANAHLKEEVSERDRRLEQAKSKIEELETRYDNLLAGHGVAGQDTEGKELARTRLSKLVREVDKCIALLNE